MTMGRRDMMRHLLGGATGVALAPLFGGAWANACGDEPRPRRVVFVIEGCGMNYTRFTPSGIPAVPAAQMLDTADFMLSPMMQALAGHRERLLLIDGLSNDQGLAGSGHSTGYAALSCVPNDPPSEIGRPGGETLDQYLGRTMGSCALFPNLMLAVGRTRSSRLACISANQALQPVPHFCNPYDAYQQIFGPVFNDRGAARVRQNAMFELVRGDIARIQPRLAGRQRIKLEQVIAAIDAIQVREQRLIEQAESLRRCAPEVDAGPFMTIEDRLDGHFQLTAAALACGLTRVATIASGCGYNFFDVPFSRLGLEGTKHQMGHGYLSALDGLDQIHNFHATQIAGLCDRLALVPEGDGSMLDNTLIVWTNDNGEQHHAGYQRWPVVLLGGANVGLRTGRYLRFPAKGNPGARTLADLWNTVTHLMDAPRNDFGAGGHEIVTGPVALG